MTLGWDWVDILVTVVGLVWIGWELRRTYREWRAQ